MQLRDFINCPVTSDHKKEFQEATPFPFILIDNFLKAEVIEKLTIPKIDERFYKYENAFENKLATDKMSVLSNDICVLLMALNSSLFIRWLEELTGIKGLLPDPHWRGGGLHAIPPGGFLHVHEDFGVNHEIGLYRRLNLLIYLNRGWKPEWGGNLELWSKDMRKKHHSIEPDFNRAVLFATPGANHGHPDPTEAPCNRLSLAMYYYTFSPPNEDLNTKSTQFKARPWDPDTPEIQELRMRRNLGRLASNV
jgi:Rps23 Pro-64 3,4-dihydroxylase Tpa1-like proline 4-hydroxylase